MIVNGIDTKDISVVVQGAVDKINTPLCLNSVRKCFPGAEVILSTWEGTDVSDLTYDKVLLNKDPGGWKDGRTGIANNLNRQLVSTKAGILIASRKYCIKIRSDIFFKSNNFLNYFDKFPKYERSYRLFKNRILFSSYFFKRYLGEVQYGIEPTPFHLSDWFAFGLREDMQLLFDIPLAQEPDNTNYFNNHKLSTARPDIFGAAHQYAPEQYILLSCVRKHMNNCPEMRSVIDYNADNIAYNDHFCASNFIILNPGQIKMFCLKNGIDPYCKWSKNELSLPIYVWEGLYRYDIFVKEYKKYCDNQYSIPFNSVLQRETYLLFRKFFEVRRL